MQQQGHWLQIKVLATLVVLALTACSDGDDGRDGDIGPPGPAIPGVTTEAQSLEVTVESVSIAGPPVVEFSMVNEAGIRFADLQPGDVRFIIAKLVAGSDGDTSRWQSYINRLEEAGSVGPGTEDAIQATAESNGELINHGDGSYTYTFATDITAVTEPLEVSYEPDLTHRLAMQFGGGLPATNPIYDWRPSDGATEDIAQREIVAIESCNECHGQLALHGGGRIEARYCVTCHNPGSRDANSGNTVDFPVMIHKIHYGEQLPSVQAGGEYAIWGFRDSKHDYSDVAMPQDVRNCSKCHDGSDAATPQGDNWMHQPNAQACGACHDDVDFDTGSNHGDANLVADNSECSVCHSDGGFVGSVAESHQIPAQLAAARFQFNILDVSNTAPGQFPEVRFSVTDPESDDATYDLNNDPAFTQLANRASRLVLDLGWDNADHHNTGSGSTPALPVNIDALSGLTANADGSYTATSPVAIPTDVSGSGVVALEGHPAADFDGDGTFSDRVPVTAALEYFAITDAQPVARRTVVEIGKCNQCHAQLSLHGDNRTDEPQLCAVCHNANATDINRRPADPATSADGLAEQAIDFKQMVHAIHGAHERENPYVVYGFGGSEHDFSHVRYPRPASDCVACHADGSTELPLADGVLATTIDTGADAADPADDMNITATAAVCSSCHDGRLAAEHMEQNGASFMTPQSMVDNGSLTETCAICHGPGRIADIESVHQQ